MTKVVEQWKHLGQGLLSEKHYRALTENISDAILLLNESAHMIYLSPSVERITGFKIPELESKTIFDFIHDEDLAHSMAFFQQVFTKPGVPASLAYRLLHKDGHYIHVEGTLTNLLHDQHIKGFVMNYRDVSERIASEAKIRDNETRFRALIENSNDMVSIINVLGIIRYLSPSVEKNLGYSNYQNKKLNISDIVHADDMDAVQLQIKTAYSNPGVPISSKIRNRKRDGSFIWVEGTITNMLLVPEVRAMVCNFRDITSQTMAEEKLRKSEQLQEAYKDIEIKNKTITDAIQYAQRLQKALFPDSNRLQSHFPKSFAVNKPQNIVGGDFYWLHEFGGQVMVACVDCTGHSVSGAFLSIIAIDLLNRIVVDQQCNEPSRVLRLLNEGINNSIGMSRPDGVSDGMDISICLIDKVKRKIRFAGAMHPIAIAGKSGTRIYRGNRYGLGGHLDAVKKHFETHDIECEKDDMLFMFTDGYRDQMGGPDDKKFMIARLIALFEKMHALPANEQKDILLKKLEEWKGDNEQTDDVLVLGMGL